LNLWQQHENERRGSHLVQTPIATAIIIDGSPMKSADTGRLCGTNPDSMIALAILHHLVTAGVAA
jgi:hypothetical protein